MNTPHGGQLVNKVLFREEKEQLQQRIDNFQSLVLVKENITDVKNIAFGLYSPLTGFLKKQDFESVVKNMRLANGIVWPIPIVLDVSQDYYNRLKNEQTILLTDSNKKPIAILENPEFYNYDKVFFAENVYGTKDKDHPGVANIYNMKE